MRLIPSLIALVCNFLVIPLIANFTYQDSFCIGLIAALLIFVANNYNNPNIKIGSAVITCFSLMVFMPTLTNFTFKDGIGIGLIAGLIVFVTTNYWKQCNSPKTKETKL